MFIAHVKMTRLMQRRALPATLRTDVDLMPTPPPRAKTRPCPNDAALMRCRTITPMRKRRAS